VQPLSLRSIDEVYGPGFVQHRGPAGDIRGRQQLRGFWEVVHATIPDLKLTRTLCISQGDVVAALVGCRGTHERPLPGVAPAGERVELVGNVFDQVIRGRIVDEWPLVDTAGLVGRGSAD
jgi:predicted ester cyclase